MKLRTKMELSLMETEERMVKDLKMEIKKVVKKATRMTRKMIRNPTKKMIKR